MMPDRFRGLCGVAVRPHTRVNLPYASEVGGVRLAVRLTPRAHRNGVDGIEEGADGRTVLRLRLVAPPVEGAANTALIAFLADALAIRKAAVTLRSGHTSRTKMLHFAGEPVALLARLATWIKAAAPPPP